MLALEFLNCHLKRAVSGIDNHFPSDSIQITKNGKKYLSSKKVKISMCHSYKLLTNPQAA